METDIIRHRSNDIVSAILHLIGVLLSVAVLVVLLVVGAREGSAWHVVGYSIYGFGLIALYVASALYHFVPESMPRFKHIARQFDHAMIYVLIAATYTPITFIVFSGGWRWSLFGVVWGLAILGLTIRFFWITAPRWFPVALYALMGWLIVVAAFPLVERMDIVSLVFLVSGGIFYTMGILFFALERVLEPRAYFWMHELFHVCVLGGSALHTIVMFRIV
ncbi:MAG: hemolysin III family protein [Patescibacteria group bacterium]